MGSPKRGAPTLQALLSLLLFCAFDFGQEGEKREPETASKAVALDQRVRAEIANFKGKVNLFAKNFDTGETYKSGGR